MKKDNGWLAYIGVVFIALATTFLIPLGVFFIVFGIMKGLVVYIIGGLVLLFVIVIVVNADTFQKGLIKDEEAYIEKLGEFSNLYVNLTSMSDEELIRLKTDAERKIFISYFIKNLYKLPVIAMKQIRHLGLRGFISNLGGYVTILREKR